jgi:poly-gamma-glutamate capsule biosynthesis protein CapA/YwtB (metallophosphatase superfamily)
LVMCVGRLERLLAGLTMQTGLVAIFFTSIFGLSILGRREVYVTGDPILYGVYRMLVLETARPLRWGWPRPGKPADVYRMELRTEPPVAGELVLGRIPRFPAVYYWNPVQDISGEELQQVLAGKIRNWAELGGEDRAIVCFSGPDPDLGKRLAREPGGLAVLYWPQLVPEVRVLQVGCNDWLSFQDRGGDGFPGCGWVVLSPVRPLAWWEELGWQLRNIKLIRRIKRGFSWNRWLYGQERLTLTAVGDIMLDRGVARTVKEQGGDYRYVFARTAPILARADRTLGNLECPLSLRGCQINMFRGHPAAAAALRAAGFDLVSLANNHILDYGPEALADTLDIVKSHGMTPLGAGRNRAEARRIHFETVNRIRAAFLAYTEVRPGFTYTRTGVEWRAGPDRAGVNPVDTEEMRRELAAARRRADVVVVTVHWGDEYQGLPNPFQRQLARELLACGADLVVGHHPHVIQGVVFGGKGAAAFSLGNFVFDQKVWDRREGLILEACFDRAGLRQVRFLPVRILGEQPRLLQGEEARRVWRRLAYLSKKLQETAAARKREMPNPW